MVSCLSASPTRKTMYHAAADFSIRRGMALESMGLYDFRYIDCSWISPWAQRSNFGLRLYAEGIDPAAVHHQHIYQILRMAAEKKNWDHQVTAEDVRQACIDRNVVNYERHVDAMAQWLNSPEAAWAFLYLGDTVRRDDAMVRSPLCGGLRLLHLQPWRKQRYLCPHGDRAGPRHCVQRAQLHNLGKV